MLHTHGCTHARVAHACTQMDAALRDVCVWRSGPLAPHTAHSRCGALVSPFRARVCVQQPDDACAAVERRLSELDAMIQRSADDRCGDAKVERTRPLSLPVSSEAHELHGPCPHA